ncbi:hypothetical protein ACTI_47950 [Actinoplanes sp. OR16]|uniref:hypothetical protein n=1 Tax=Actinoplanes sp. OR16 TaxID=946334 RepID=UPI000F6DDF7E|nr:hypothetical protein [Actinoplanes sp. OR16]BBH68110.1 hypothetical protein ACTI_47950 [Actinoplanes sp. OR16]
MVSGWLGRRSRPRLSGTLHIRDTAGRELAVPLRGRATVLTAYGTGLTGYGEVHAVHTTPGSTDTSLMISYGRDGSADLRESGLCAPGETVLLGGVAFTWRHQPAAIPRPRSAAPNMPRTLRPAATAQPANAHPAPAAPTGRLENLLRNRPADAPRPTTPNPRPNSTT